MKHLVTILLLMGGIVFLVVGYTTPARARAAITRMRDAKREVGSWLAEQDRKYPLASEGKPTRAQEHLLGTMTDTLEQTSSEVRGAIQYCTGWLIVSAACGVWVLGCNQKSPPPSNQ